MEYGNKIFEIYNKPFKYRNSSSTNYNKVRANGIEPNTKFVVIKQQILIVQYILDTDQLKKFFTGVIEKSLKRLLKNVVGILESDIYN